MPPPPDAALRALPLTATPPDPRRLELLAAVLQNGGERPGQIRALMVTDCGLCRQYWLEVHTGRPLVWLGLAEVLTARTRSEMRRWLSTQRRPASPAATAAALAAPAGELAAHERYRRNALQRALCGRQVIRAGWQEFDPAPGAEPNVPGVRSPYERYLLMLDDRIFLTNLGVLPVAEWFRPPIEALAGFDPEKLRVALERRWAETAAQFPGLEAESVAWEAAFNAAGGLFPPRAEIERELAALWRMAGLTAVPDHPLTGATP